MENTVVEDSMTKNRRVVDVTRNESNILIPENVIDIETNCNCIIGYAQEPLLSLFKACFPLINTIYNLLYYVQIALNETATHPPDGLTIDESAAIRLYTMEWEEPHESLYVMLNDNLKKGTHNDLRPYFKYMKLLLTALTKLPCVPISTVWRGVTKDFSKELIHGTKVTWLAFSSCTNELTVLENNMYLGSTGDRTLFSIEVLNGRSIHAHSHFVNENEILLLPGTQMIVQSQFSPAPNLQVIHLKQIIPKEITLEPPFDGACIYPKRFEFWNKKILIPTCLLTILIVVAIITGVIFGIRSGNKTKIDYTDLTAELNLARMKYNLPGLSALVFKNGQIVAQGASGYRRHNDPTPLLVTDPFNLGGNSLWMTVTLAGRLIDRKMISWTTQIYECFPNYESFNTVFHNITLEELLAHRSGIQDEVIFYQKHYRALLLQNGTFRQIRSWVAEIVLKDAPQIERGRYLYASQGYIVAVVMMEQMTGDDWESLIREHIFIPLKMSNTTVGLVFDDVIPPQKPVGHDMVSIPAEPIALRTPSKTFLHSDQGANGPSLIACTLQDWANFVYAHITAESTGYLSAETVAKLSSPFNNETEYGLSISIYDRVWARPGKALMFHGYIYGQDTFFVMGPSRNLVVVTYTNSYIINSTSYNHVLNTVIKSLVVRYA